MPPILHAGCTMKCKKCNAPIQVVTQNTRLQVGAAGHLALLRNDTFTVMAGPACDGPQQKMPPCNTVVWGGDALSPILQVNGTPVLLQVGTAGKVGVGGAGVLALPPRSEVTIEDPGTPLHQA